MCLYPRFAKFSQTFKPNGKRDIYFVSSDKRFDPDTIVIPCGKCEDCKLDYARDWSVRCMCESTLWNDNYFVTLTYNDENLPEALPVCSFSDLEIENFQSLVDMSDDTISFDEVLYDKIAENRMLGNEFFMSPLVPKHFTQFMKSVRQRWKRDYNFEGIRFFGCGEYGSKSLRPHYHLIMFNFPIFDLQLYKYNNGNPLYVSEVLNSVWNKGYVVIGKVSPQSCGYVARYNYKKQISKQNIFGVPHEFVRMSRNPGIASMYFSKHYEELVKSQFSVYFDGREYRNISYFKRLACGFDLDTLRDINSYSEVVNALRDRTLFDVNMLSSRSQKTLKARLLKNENLGLDKHSQLLYNNRVKNRVNE